MKKLSEKVALVAELCIALVFIITTILYMTNAIPQSENWQENGVMSVLMIVLGIIFLGLAAYLIYMNFSDKQNLKQILLFSDSESATLANVKVVENIVSDCAKQVKGISVKRLRVNSDEKGGLIAHINLKVSVENVAESVAKLRFLMAESFKKTLGLTFNNITFHIERTRGKISHDIAAAEQAAEKMTEKNNSATETVVLIDDESAPEKKETAEETDPEKKETEDA